MASPEVIALAPLDALPVMAALRSHAFAYPALEAVHVLGVALLAGSAIAFDLRLLGVHRSIPVPVLARHLLRLALAALALVVPSGLVMFAAHATALLTDGVFLVKMGLLLVAAANAAMFHAVLYRPLAALSPGAGVPLAARAAAAASIVLWVAVIVCGQLLRLPR